MLKRRADILPGIAAPEQSGAELLHFFPVLRVLQAASQKTGDLIAGFGCLLQRLFPQLPRHTAAVKLAARLRSEGESVNLSLRPQKPKKFFSHADQSCAAKAVFIGPDDVEKGVARIKDLAARTEEELCLS